MTIRRLRPAYDELREIYVEQYDHTKWEDHIQRVQATLDCIHAWTVKSERRIVADLSCGDAAVARGVDGAACLILGDYVHNDAYALTGRIEHTLDRLGYVDLFILSETLEHIDEPITLLTKLRQHTHFLLISTPLDEQDDGNPEHYWGWDEDGIRDLLEMTGWNVRNHTTFTPQVAAVYYTYQIWGATSV